MLNLEQQEEFENPFAPFSEDAIKPLIEFFKDDTLLKDMYKFAEQEEYTMAIIYRNELIRRGVLEPVILL